jgi:CDP-glycerol glycerophosphotransferase
MAVATRARRALRRSRRIPRSQWVAHWRRRPVQSDVVLWEATGGAGLICHPYAVFLAVAQADDLQHLRHVWVVRDPDDRERARAQLRDLGLGPDRVRVVGYRTLAYHRHLATAGWLVNNATFPAEFGKRQGQVYLNTWHGTPLKSMGYDTPDGVLATRNIVRNLLAADHLVSSGPFMTDVMYRSAYRLDGIFRGRILEVGSPRTDRQVSEDVLAREAVRERLRGRGVALDDRRVVLIAPTWRGERFGDPRFGAEDVARLVQRIEAELGAAWQVLVKAHPVVHGHAAARPELSARLVPPDIPANDVIGIVDHVVTDYSSILFDVLASPGLPMTFHVPHAEKYERSRPPYVDLGDLPGRVATSVAEVVDDIRAGGSHAERRAPWTGRYAPFDDGHATERVVDAVWRGARSTPTGRHVAGIDATGRAGLPPTRLLIHAGPLQRNGITAALLALLGHLDLDRLDVTVIWGAARAADPDAFVSAVDPRVRLLPRVGGLGGPKRVVWARRLLERYGADHPLVPMRALVGLMREEWVRCLGDARFDHVVDFSGYAPFWALLTSRGVAPGPVRTHSIWLHNDLAAEAAKTIGGRRTHARSLRAVFSLYRRFDRLVSVSAALSAVNERSLGGYAAAGTFRSARNLIDASRVRQRATQDLRTLGLPDAVVAALRDPGRTTFVTAGRFSPEKNHARLVRATAAVVRSGHDVAVVVMGSGPLDAELRALVQEQGLTDTVLFTGHVANPMPVIAQADCFVLSSDHEGLPMVLLEALSLGTPVLSTAFSSVEGVIPPGAGRVVPRDDVALAHAMMDVAESPAESRAQSRAGSPAEPPGRPASVDVESYNMEALAEFAAAIDLDLVRGARPAH